MSLTVKETDTLKGCRLRLPGARVRRMAPRQRCAMDVMPQPAEAATAGCGGGGRGVFCWSLWFGLLRKPAYLAESLIYIEPLASKVLSDGTSGSYDAGTV